MTGLYNEPEISAPLTYVLLKGILIPKRLAGAGTHIITATFEVIGQERNAGIIGLSSAPHIYFL